VYTSFTLAALGPDLEFPSEKCCSFLTCVYEYTICGKCRFEFSLGKVLFFWGLHPFAAAPGQEELGGLHSSGRSGTGRSGAVYAAGKVPSDTVSAGHGNVPDRPRRSPRIIPAKEYGPKGTKRVENSR
jgi:hypothetical protein